MFERIRYMLRKEFIQVLRDPHMNLTLFLTPVMQLLIYGYAVTTDIRNVQMAVMDLDNSPASRELVSRFEGSGYFNLVEHVDSEDRCREMLDLGQAQMVLRMNSGFGATIAAGRTASLQALLDGTDSNAAGIILSYTSTIVGDFSADLLERRERRLLGTGGGIRGPAERVASVELRTRAWFNDNLESRNFFVPGTVVHLVTLSALVLTSMAIVREKEIGTMEQILVMPITPLEFILGKTLPFVIIGLADVALITSVGWFWFGVPLRGSVALLFVSALVYLLTPLGAGLVISVISRTQQQASMSVFFFYFPAFLLSGFVFPIDSMPLPVQYVTYVNPVRYALVIVRGIFLKGVGLETLWPQMLILAGMGVVSIAVASKRFRKTLT